MWALIEKQRLRDIDGFFFEIFFYLHSKKKIFMGNKVCENSVFARTVNST